MASVKFIVRESNVRTDGKFLITIRITKDRKVTYISTGQYIELRYWDREVKSSCPEYKRLTILLNRKKEEVMQKLLDEEIKNPHVTTRHLKYALKRKNGDFFAFAEKMKANYSGSTLEKYEGTIKKLTDFNGDKLAFTEITGEFLKRFELSLKKEGNGINTIAGRMSRVRTILYAAHKSGEADRNLNPFDDYKIRWIEGSMEYLTVAELDKLRGLETKDEKLLQARDIFLFQANCWGMRISDALSVKWADIDKNNILHYKMIKTKKQLPAMELTPEVIRIIGERKEGYVFPYMERFKEIDSAEAYINAKLKKIAKLAGITKNLSTHVARHTWTSLAVEKIGNTWLIKDMLGHSSITTTQKYAKRFNSKEMNEANKKIMG